MISQSNGQIGDLIFGIGDGLGIEILRSAKNMKALERQPKIAHGPQQIRHRFGINAKLAGAAAHMHPRTAQFEIGIDPHRHPWRDPQKPPRFHSADHFLFGF